MQTNQETDGLIASTVIVHTSKVQFTCRTFVALNVIVLDVELYFPKKLINQ